jgi:arabinose-5-phosphate isomerase
MSSEDYQNSALRTIRLESEAVAAMSYNIDSSFDAACEILMSCSGRVVVIGMGKSGHVANKVAATLASTGTPAFFVHPGEASHGDIGMITENDVVLSISSSGATLEIIALLPLIKRLGIPLITMTGDNESPLAAAAAVNLNIGVEREACPLNLAPTTSTTVSLVLGDALAIALLESRGFTAEDFAFSHPGGALGRKLLLRVQDVMHSEEKIPKVQTFQPLKDALLEMTTRGFGMTSIIDENGKLAGIFTDGDLRRTIDRGLDIRTTRISAVMSEQPITVREHILAAEAMKIMEDNSITVLLVENEEKIVSGIVHMHDLISARVV